MQHLDDLQQLYNTVPIEEALKKTAELFPGQVRFSSSLGQEDQMLTHIIAAHNLPINIFTLDTGRLFQETYDLLDVTMSKYKINIDVFFPQAQSVQQMVKDNGINLFYASIENRQYCCGVRKVEPLNRALQDCSVWITGLRAAQNDHRKNVPVVEWLEDKQLYKINPLLYYSFDEVLAYLNEHNVPFNPLHNKGFISIGCAPCTRAIEPGEDVRAGRWWWEQSHKECGLHLAK